MEMRQTAALLRSAAIGIALLSALAGCDTRATTAISPRGQGPDNLEVAAMRCTNCHDLTGNDPSSGAAGWSLTPAVANAIAAVTGRRMSTMPFNLKA